MSVKNEINIEPLMNAVKFGIISIVSTIVFMVIYMITISDSLTESQNIIIFGVLGLTPTIIFIIFVYIGRSTIREMIKDLFN